MTQEQEKEMMRITKILGGCCSPDLFNHLHDALIEFYTERFEEEDEE